MTERALYKVLNRLVHSSTPEVQEVLVNFHLGGKGVFDVKSGEAKNEQLRSPKFAHHLYI